MQSPLQEILSQLSLTQEIRTSRLTLRPFRQDDLQVLSRLRAIPEVMQWTSQGRVDRDGETQAWMSMFIYEGDSSPRHNFNFVVILRGNPPEDASQPGFAEDQIIGVCGLTALDSLPVSPLPNFGYMFFPETWGKGYATEAVMGFQIAWQHIIRSYYDSAVSTPNGPNLGLIRAVTLEGNMGSSKVLERCGWRVYETAERGPHESRVLRWVLDSMATL